MELGMTMAPTPSCSRMTGPVPLPPLARSFSKGARSAGGGEAEDLPSVSWRCFQWEKLIERRDQGGSPSKKNIKIYKDHILK